MASVKQWLQEKLITPAKLLSSFQIGLAVAVGVWGGIFPIPAMSTFATLAFCTTIMRSMFTAAMTTISITINLIVTPIQLMAMPFFMNLPSKLTGASPCSVGDLVTSIQTKPFLETCSTFGLCMIWAVLAWTVLSPVSIFVIRLLVATVVRTSKHD